MRTRASKSASKVRCTCRLAKLARPARSYLMGASAVPSGRCGIAWSTRRWVSFSSKSVTPLGEGRAMPGGATGARARRCYTISLLISCHKPADLHRRSRAMFTRTFTVQSGTALGRSGLRNWSECTITFVCAASEVIRVPEFGDGHLPTLTIDPIDEAANDLIVEDDSDSDY